VTSDLYDVVIVGYGPVSRVLALALGRQGRKVAVIERWHERYALPRAVCIDHEVYRILSANGLSDSLPSIAQGGVIYQWLNAEWRQLLSIDWTTESISGCPLANFIHQPSLEELLDGKLTQLPNVTLLAGHEATAASQDYACAWVNVEHIDTGRKRVVRGRYVVGCDGAKSLIRDVIGSEQDDRGFEADWLVIDVVLRDGVTIEALGIPEAAQYCNPAQPTTMGPAGIRKGRRYRRWEFMKPPGMPVSELDDEAQVWRLLSPWVKPEHVELVRHKVYTFRSLLADSWRDRRILIAGDAAHVMPPFLGQGLCSGIRDVWNLAWKLSLVLDGLSSDTLLDSYQIERSAHVSQLIDASIYLGKIICIADPHAAAERDEAFLAGNYPPLPEFPCLNTGFLMRTDDGGIPPGAGQLSPHVNVRNKEQTGRLDAMFGACFMLIATSEVAISDAHRRQFQRIGGQILIFAENSLEDLDNRIGNFLLKNGWSVILVRPDYYVFGGGAQVTDSGGLLDRLFEQLVQAGLCLS
jgi:2-polyprenyl-6-methoxyphenol hydroxylase-like FAD-dependent oxidoreductase